MAPFFEAECTHVFSRQKCSPELSPRGNISIRTAPQIADLQAKHKSLKNSIKRQQRSRLDEQD